MICARVRRKEGRGTGESDLRRRRCAVVDLAGEDVRQALFCSLSAQIKPGPFAAAPALFPFNCPCLPLILKQLYWALFSIGNALMGVNCYTCLCGMSLSLLQSLPFNVTVTHSHVNPQQTNTKEPHVSPVPVSSSSLLSSACMPHENRANVPKLRRQLQFTGTIQ